MKLFLKDWSGHRDLILGNVSHEWAKTKVRGIHIRSIHDDICHHTLVIIADLDIVDSLYEVELLAFGHGIRLVISFAR